jgi:DNA repair protein Crb2 Tudor domain
MNLSPLSQISSPDNNPLQYLSDSFNYHAEKLQLRSSSTLSQLSPLSSIPAPSTSRPQGGDTSFKVPSFPSISSIRRTDGESSLAGISDVNDVPLSRFFQSTQESPLQDEEQCEVVVPSPLTGKGSSRKSTSEEEQEEEDSFGATPEEVRRKLADEERAHRVFEELRKIKVDARKLVREDSLTDDLFFGARSKVGEDGVRRVIKTVSEGGFEAEQDTSNDSRKRASTAPVNEVRTGSNSSVIPNSQPSNGPNTTVDHSGESNNESHGEVKESPVQSSPAVPSSLPPARDPTEPHPYITPHRSFPLRSIPSSIQQQQLDTPTLPKSHEIPLVDMYSVPETSPLKHPSNTEGFRTANESFVDETVGSSPPVVVHGRSRRGGVIESSNPSDFARGREGRKRARTSLIREEGDEGEEEEDNRSITLGRSPGKKPRFTGSPDLGAAGSLELDIDDVGIHRIMARFKDNKMNYYPAMVVEPPSPPQNSQELSEDTEILVRFDDGTETEVPLRHIRRLDFRPGDTVKFVEGPSRTNFTVIKTECDPSISSATDISGNNVLIVHKKSHTEQLRFPLEKVFLNGTLFAQLHTRTYTLTKPASQARLPRPRTLSPYLPRRTHSTLFKGMAFAISVEDPGARELLQTSIVSRSGTVLPEGLHEMFPPPGEQLGALGLHPGWLGTTFCAVLAEKYSRKVKYLQALALAVPCLSLRWVDSCVRSV